MPLSTRLGRMVRLTTLPETRALIGAAVHSRSVRTLIRRAVDDRRSLLRDLLRPRSARQLVQDTVRHPAAAELANVGLVFLPIRFIPVGWVATWAARRLLRGSYSRPSRNRTTMTITTMPTIPMPPDR